MPVIFRGPTLQGKERIAPGVSLAFEDENAEPYFIAAGFADATDLPPVMTYPAGSVEIDPDTIHTHGTAALTGASAGDPVVGG